MARYLKIKKIDVKENEHFYIVLGKEQGYLDCFISINPIEKKLVIYSDDQFLHPVHIINFNNPDEFFSVPNVPPLLLGPIISTALRAIKKNEFPADLDYCS
jgi:hypothetical protein